MTLIDALLAATILMGIGLNAVLGWWWSDPVSALVIVYYGAHESRHAWREAK
jgi:divalent metal cation (Fe/Co/Zn/Cd) transporter